MLLSVFSIHTSLRSPVLNSLLLTPFESSTSRPCAALNHHLLLLSSEPTIENENNRRAQRTVYFITNNTSLSDLSASTIHVVTFSNFEVRLDHLLHFLSCC
jgi:hypothetical protein